MPFFFPFFEQKRLLPEMRNDNTSEFHDALINSQPTLRRFTRISISISYTYFFFFLLSLFTTVERRFYSPIIVSIFSSLLSTLYRNPTPRFNGERKFHFRVNKNCHFMLSTFIFCSNIKFIFLFVFTPLAKSFCFPKTLPQ